MGTGSTSESRDVLSKSNLESRDDLCRSRLDSRDDLSKSRLDSRDNQSRSHPESRDELSRSRHVSTASVDNILDEAPPELLLDNSSHLETTAELVADLEVKLQLCAFSMPFLCLTK